MATTVPFTKNREVIYGLLKRARRYHCTCTGQYEIDVTELLDVLDAYRAAGDPLSINAVLIRATSLVLKQFPRLNHHLFHGLFKKREVAFDDICCNVIMARRENNETILLPLMIPSSDELSIREIDEILTYNQTTPLDELPQIQGMQKLKRMPLIVLKWFSFKCRSDPRFYRRYFGTYGFSSGLFEGKKGVRLGDAGVVSQSANTCTGFIPASVVERPVVRDGEIVVRKILNLVMLMDHYLIDGHDGLVAVKYLQRLLENPEKLELTAPQSEGKPSSSQVRE